MGAVIPLAITRELRRLAVDPEACPGLASSPTLSLDDLITWLRHLPTGLGTGAFLHTLRTAGPRPGVGAEVVPPRDASIPSPDLDLHESFDTEMRRVLPLPSGTGWALLQRPDLNRIVPLLRALPDGAGWDAVSAVLPIVRVVEG